MKFKSFKSILLTTSLTVGISLFSSNAYAATYTAVSGDSLYKISYVFNTTVANLMQDNHLAGYNINIGQKFCVPSMTHTVVKGESLFLISKMYRIPMETLRRANNIYNDYLDIGQMLNVPVVLTPSSSLGMSESTLAAKSESSCAADSTAAPSTSSSPISHSAPASTETSAYSASDLDLLARLITAEAQGQQYQAKVAVGAVVINRVKSGLFESTISKVIYQTIDGYYQFTPVLNGWINKPAEAESIKAAKEALSGVDPTNGALFYFDNTTTNKWLLSRQVTTVIDDMTFTY